MSAWTTAFAMFAVNLVASIFYLAQRHRSSAATADAVAVSAAEIGVLFCSIGLMTGMLWAKPVWGIWWTWDPRLASTFVLWLIYMSYLMLRRLSAGEQAPTLAAALAIFGFVDVPIVYMSIRWWRTQHPQPVLFGDPGSGLDPSMLPALLINMAGFLGYGVLIFWVRYKLERERRNVLGTAGAAFARTRPRGGPLMDTARSLLHLHAAYILTWCVQLGYVMYLLAEFIRVKREKEELKK